MTKNLLLFLFVIFLGVAAYYIIHLGHYPVALVNGKIITAKSLNEEYAVAAQYYMRALSQQKDIDPNGVDIQKELRRASLNDLIDKALIDAELKARAGGDFDSLVAGKLTADAPQGQSLAEAAKALYGLDLDHFKAMVLVPQAEREILENKLYLENTKFADWLADAEKAARVTILTPEFGWSDGKVASSK